MKHFSILFFIAAMGGAFASATPYDLPFPLSSLFSAPRSGSSGDTARTGVSTYRNSKSTTVKKFFHGVDTTYKALSHEYAARATCIGYIVGVALILKYHETTNPYQKARIKKNMRKLFLTLFVLSVAEYASVGILTGDAFTRKITLIEGIGSALRIAFSSFIYKRYDRIINFCREKARKRRYTKLLAFHDDIALALECIVRGKTFCTAITETTKLLTRCSKLGQPHQ